MFEAVQGGSIDIIRLLVIEGPSITNIARIAINLYLKGIEPHTGEGQTIEILELLMSHRFRLPKGAADHAARGGKILTLRWMLDRGIEVEGCDRHHPIHMI